MRRNEIEQARRAIARASDMFGESRIRAGRDHDVLEAARWSVELLAEVERMHAMNGVSDS